MESAMKGAETIANRKKVTKVNEEDLTAVIELFSPILQKRARLEKVQVKKCWIPTSYESDEDMELNEMECVPSVIYFHSGVIDKVNPFVTDEDIPITTELKRDEPPRLMISERWDSANLWIPTTYESDGSEDTMESVPMVQNRSITNEDEVLIRYERRYAHRLEQAIQEVGL